jgi:hypothetical protein
MLRQIKEVIHLYEENIIDNYAVARNIIYNLKSNVKTIQNKGNESLAYYIKFTFLILLHLAIYQQIY